MTSTTSAGAHSDEGLWRIRAKAGPRVQNQDFQRQFTMEVLKVLLEVWAKSYAFEVRITTKCTLKVREVLVVVEFFTEVFRDLLIYETYSRITSNK